MDANVQRNIYFVYLPHDNSESRGWLFIYVITLLTLNWKLSINDRYTYRAGWEWHKIWIKVLSTS